MSFLLELLRRLGLEGGAIAAAACLLVAFYLFRARSVAGRAVGAGAAAFGYTMAVLFALSVGLALGWFDPNTSAMAGDLRVALRELVEIGTGPARRWFRRLVDMALSAS